ncbi:methylenetetrahydrofolate reductase [NAD(P)H] [Faecalispora anaeroviscerum]|uniref:methylenetetrahydrofolate reductase [NAD(P)H] n=1 Tax=Faecalispora anaeroviscerum TaxID=2991836 RepID=UPI0024BB2095|nr:methylenetetrahydrofolate reductase [NAD(P)H] [Faecalispora anaeroviscerum]
MKLNEIISENRPTLSFEIFPPKNSGPYESIQPAIAKIAELVPSYMSVTYGAGGGTSSGTVSIAVDIQKAYHVPVLAHLSCINSTREGVHTQLDALREAGIENVLALRGDLAPETKTQKNWHYHYASELVREIREYGGFCVGGACYPEGHTESSTQMEDIAHLKEKVDAGCDFLTTQMFFDNNIYYNYVYKLREAGIQIPVVAGIMPVTNLNQIRRIMALSGTVLPQRFRYILDRFGENSAAMKQAGIAYATEQIIDLFANGVPAVHVYSMNNPSVAQKIQENLSEILK